MIAVAGISRLSRQHSFAVRRFSGAIGLDGWQKPRTGVREIKE
ncbi:hypothetical protein [Sphingopyxis sp. PAMC25046]|nr:hypothetical protein [Sphingopyxis sp. PAMC25046]